MTAGRRAPAAMNTVSTASPGAWFFPRMSRRNALQGVFAGAACLLFGAQSAGRPLLAQQSGPCSARRDGENMVLSFETQAVVQGRTLSFYQSVTQSLRRGGVTAIRISVTLDDTPLLQADASKLLLGRALSLRVSARFGDPSKSVKGLTFTSKEGKYLSGSIDGRPILPFEIGSDPKSLRFVDGKALLSAPIDAATQSAIQAILASLVSSPSKYLAEEECWSRGQENPSPCHKPIACAWPFLSHLSRPLSWCERRLSVRPRSPTRSADERGAGPGLSDPADRNNRRRDPNMAAHPAAGGKRSPGSCAPQRQ